MDRWIDGYIYIYIPIFLYNAIFIYTVVGCNCCLVFGVTTNMFPFKQTYFCTLRPLRMSLGRFFTRTRNPFCHLLSVNQRPHQKIKTCFEKKQADSKSTTWIEMQDNVCLHHIDDVLKQVCSVRRNHSGFVTWQQSFLCFDATPFAQDEIYLVTWFCIVFSPMSSPVRSKRQAGFSRRLWYKLNFTRRKTNKPLEAPNTLTCTECAGLLRLRGRHYGRIGQIGTPRLYGFQPSGFHSRRTRAHGRHAECIGFTVTPRRTWWVDVVCSRNHLQLACFKGLVWWIF